MGELSNINSACFCIERLPLAASVGGLVELGGLVLDPGGRELLINREPAFGFDGFFGSLVVLGLAPWVVRAVMRSRVLLMMIAGLLLVLLVAAVLSSMLGILRCSGSGVLLLLVLRVAPR